MNQICFKDKQKKDLYFGMDENVLYFHTKVYIFLPFIFSKRIYYN